VIKSGLSKYMGADIGFRNKTMLRYPRPSFLKFHYKNGLTYPS